MLQNPWDTEDVIQSVAVKLTDKLPLLRSLEGPRLTAYLAAACRNTALNHRRETQRRAEYPYSEELGCPGQSLAAQNLLPEMEDRFLALRQAWKGLEGPGPAQPVSPPGPVPGAQVLRGDRRLPGHAAQERPHGPHPGPAESQGPGHGRPGPAGGGVTRLPRPFCRPRWKTAGLAWRNKLSLF